MEGKGTILFQTQEFSLPPGDSRAKDESKTVELQEHDHILLLKDYLLTEASI